ncbi:MAG: DUF5805 domain-containing protein [Halodesulfurarchaeum sp.]
MTEMDEAHERVAITTYVPSFQKAEWESHAEALDMSQSEFIRTMVQAGRRGFGDSTPEEPDSRRANPGGDVRQTVLQRLESQGELSWEELYDEIATDLETRVEEAIIELQEEGLITHKPRNGTYAIEDQ